MVVMGRTSSVLCQGKMSSGSWSAGGGDGGREGKVIGLLAAVAEGEEDDHERPVLLLGSVSG